MGLTQQPNGVDMLREILNIILLKGSIGIQGGWTLSGAGA